MIHHRLHEAKNSKSLLDFLREVDDPFSFISIDIVDSLCDKFPIENNFDNSLVEKTDTFLSHIDDSFPEYETYCFDMEEKSSGITTTHSDYSLLDYDAFYFDDDHIEDKSSGSTTTHYDISLPEYDSFIFDLSIDPFPPADRSVSHHEEFADELAHIISPSEYDRFYFDLEIVPGDFTRVLNPFVEIPSGESKVHIEVLSVLWGNRLPIPDGSLPLSSTGCGLTVVAPSLTVRLLPLHAPFDRPLLPIVRWWLRYNVGLDDRPRGTNHMVTRGYEVLCRIMTAANDEVRGMGSRANDWCKD
ncbi:hypothetical protein Tco_0177911 [Tanacetum coccineum]